MVLDDIYKLHEIQIIDTFEKAVELNDFVFSLVPHNIKKEPLDVNKPWYEYYELFKEKKFFGWCHTNALYLLILLKHFGRESYLYNYGIREKTFTHVVTIVTIKDSQYLLDPYFNRHYVDENDNPLTFNELLDRSVHAPDSVTSVYGDSMKTVFHEEVNAFVDFTPQRLEESVVNAWRVNLGFDGNPLSLITQKIQKVAVLTKSRGDYSFDVF